MWRVKWERLAVREAESRGRESLKSSLGRSRGMSSGVYLALPAPGSCHCGTFLGPTNFSDAAKFEVLQACDRPSSANDNYNRSSGVFLFLFCIFHHHQLHTIITMAGTAEKRKKREAYRSSLRADEASTALPRKKFYRQRAHANPFSDHKLL